MKTMTRTDVDLQQDVLDEFDWDPEIDPTEIGVQVQDGIVTLSGAVDPFSKKVAAERASLRVEGVRAVANDLVVHLPGARDDTAIARMAADALEANVLVPPGRIDVTVKQGSVTLSGEVGWDYQRKAAFNSIRHLRDVRDVINRVRVTQPVVSEFEVKVGIERALVRAAEIDAGHIRVFTEDGTVRLTGLVRSWAEKEAATEAAWRAKGVTRVLNEIDVRAR